LLAAHGREIIPAMPASLPSKRDVALALLVKTSVHVHLDPRRLGVEVPPNLKSQAQLVLQVGRSMAVPIPDLVVDERGIRGTLSFSRLPFFCVLPWESIFALVGDDTRGQVWSDDAPVEVREEMESKGLPERLQKWSVDVVERMRAAGPVEPRRVVVEVQRRRLVVDLRKTTFGTLLELTLGDRDAGGAQAGPYRSGAPTLGGVPPFEMQRRTPLVKPFAFLGLVREIRHGDTGFDARVSVRSRGPAEPVRALLDRAALRDATVDLFDHRYHTIAVAPRAGVVEARLPDPTMTDLSVRGLGHAWRALTRIFDALATSAAAGPAAEAVR
jgi:hypothetical protein